MMFAAKIIRVLLLTVVALTIVVGVAVAAPAAATATASPAATATTSTFVATANAALQMLGTVYAGTGIAQTTSPVPPSATPTPSATSTVAISGGTGSSTDSSGGERLCSNIVLGGYSGTTPATPSVPSETITKTCDGSKITVVVSSPTRFGNRIGDVIEVDITISADPSIIIDFTSLTQGALKLQSRSPLMLALRNPVTISAPQTVNGRNISQIRVRVQNMLPAPVSFSLDLRYRVVSEQSGWKVLTTPDFLLTYSATVDSGTEFLNGEPSEAVVRQPWLLNVLLLVAALLIALPIANEFRIWLKRRRPDYVPSASDVAWHTLIPIFEGAGNGFDAKELGAIERTLRKFLEHDYAGSLSMTRQELAEHMASDARCSAVISVLTVCDRALYSPDAMAARIDGAEAWRLVKQLQNLIPQDL